MKEEKESTYQGIVQHIFFHAEDTGWTAFKLAHVKPDDSMPSAIQENSHGCTFGASGYFSSLHEGEEIEVSGTWECHDTYGWQLKIKTSIPLIPTTADGIQRFLASSATFGIGPVTAKRLVDKFGTETITILDKNDPVTLQSVNGIGQKKAGEILKGWQNGGVVRDTMIALAGYGVGELTAIKLMRHYGTRLLEVLNKDPYVLADEVDGIGFKKADKIAGGMGIQPSDPRRLKGAVKYSLQNALSGGDCYLSDAEIGKEVEKLIQQVPRGEIQQMIEDKELHFEQSAEGYYLLRVYRAERAVAEMIQKKITDKSKDAREKLFHVKQFSEILTDEQRKAVEMALTSPISILTGGPGTGKTTTINEIVRICEDSDPQIELLLCAPTGRAAKRLEEVTNREARTIHRLLEYNPIVGGFSRNENYQLDGDVLVVDEVSMVDIFLMDSLLRAIPEGMSLVMVGDKDQLPSVGPGNVLRDLLEVR